MNISSWWDKFVWGGGGGNTNGCRATDDEIKSFIDTLDSMIDVSDQNKLCRDYILRNQLSLFRKYAYAIKDLDRDYDLMSDYPYYKTPEDKRMCCQQRVDETKNAALSFWKRFSLNIALYALNQGWMHVFSATINIDRKMLVDIGLK